MAKLMIIHIDPPSSGNNWYQHHLRQLIDSYERLLNKPFLFRDSYDSNASNWAEQVFKMDEGYLLSHDASEETLLNYANQKALSQWEMTWEELVLTSSRQTAPPLAIEERTELMETVDKQGYVTNYRGKRISKTGRLFWIKDVTIWKYYDTDDQYLGIAAAFPSVSPLR